ncbi:hypothetical protein BpHYR1_052125 [Brachionus plicatilis]|uniref:Uncharacterized protein n=1 Tax=Brachionus plicatilis TaxID=10195 RepID=A0A3M7RXQ9_BRAPC|nr:hypothetical protein BpHYR1_052125 [Brachionus plicatilis]
MSWQSMDIFFLSHSSTFPAHCDYDAPDRRAGWLWLTKSRVFHYLPANLFEKPKVTWFSTTSTNLASDLNPLAQAVTLRVGKISDKTFDAHMHLGYEIDESLAAILPFGFDFFRLRILAANQLNSCIDPLVLFSLTPEQDIVSLVVGRFNFDSTDWRKFPLSTNLLPRIQFIKDAVSASRPSNKVSEPSGLADGIIKMLVLLIKLMSISRPTASSPCVFAINFTLGSPGSIRKSLFWTDLPIEDNLEMLLNDRWKSWYSSSRRSSIGVSDRDWTIRLATKTSKIL